MPDLLKLAQQFMDDGRFSKILRNPMAQFGDPNSRRNFMGAMLLPEEQRTSNMYDEAGVQFLSVIAQDSSPLSPPKLQSSTLFGSTTVKFGHHDIKVELNAQELEALMQMMAMGQESLAEQRLLSWVDSSVNLSLKTKQEKQRWQAIVDAQVTRMLGDGSTETVAYNAPNSHRFNAAEDWSDDTFDPFDDIAKAWQILWDLGYEVAYNITSSSVAGILGKNAKVRANAGYMTVDTSGAVVPVASRSFGTAVVNEVIARSSSPSQPLPPIQTYDLNYVNASGTREYFLPRNCFVVIGRTGDRRPVLANDELFYFDDTLGYYGIGKVDGYEELGPIFKGETRDKKPRAIVAEGYVTGFPVIFSKNMEAIVVIKNIA
jgi:hypothetical protein